MSETGSKVRITDSVEVSSRTSLSILYIQAAAFHCRRSHSYEEGADLGPLGPEERSRVHSEHSSYVLGAVMSAAMFLEATINELFLEANDEFKQNLSALSESQIEKLSQTWDSEISGNRSLSILEKYGRFLDCVDADQFEKGMLIYQNADCLTDLRNALAHYKPEWKSATSHEPQSKQSNIYQALRGRFEMNPLTGGGNPFFPDRCMSHGCAAWAVESSTNFVDEFVKLAGIACPFDHVRSELNVTSSA